MLHGNTGWKEEEHLSTLADKLAENGIASIRFDSPGSGESDGTWQDDYRVSNYLAAVPKVYDYATRTLNLDANRAGIWGHSMGGMVAIYAAAQQPDTFKAVCGSQPSSGAMSRNFSEGIEQWRTQGGVNIETEIFGTVRLPVAYFIDREQYNTLEAVKQIHAPLLLIAGLNDEIVSRESVQKIFHAANEPKKFLEYPADHLYKYDPATLEQINDDTVTFFSAILI